MSERNAEVVRRAYGAWNEDGPAAMGPWLADDVELHDAPQLPDAQVWKGRDAVVERFQSVAESLGGGSVDFEGFHDAGDEITVVMCWQIDNPNRQVPLGQVFHVVGVTDGRISCIRVFLTETDARDA